MANASSWSCLNFFLPNIFHLWLFVSEDAEPSVTEGWLCFLFLNRIKSTDLREFQPGLSCYPTMFGRGLALLPNPAPEEEVLMGLLAGSVPSHVFLAAAAWTDVLPFFFLTDLSVFCLSKVFFLKRKVLIATLCLTLWDPMDCSAAGSSVHGILQARLLEWVALAFSRGIFQGSNPHLLHCMWILGLQDLSSPTRDWTRALGSESADPWPLDSQAIPSWSFA